LDSGNTNARSAGSGSTKPEEKKGQEAQPPKKIRKNLDRCKKRGREENGGGLVNGQSRKGEGTKRGD